MPRSRRLVLLTPILLASMALAALAPGGPARPAAAAGANPFAGIRWVPNTPVMGQAAAWRAAGRAADADTLARAIAPHQVVQWVGDWFAPGLPDRVLTDTLDPTWAAGGTPLVALYNVPNRDCNGQSGGTPAQDAAAYAAWVARVARVIGERRAIILLEPDGLTVVYCFVDRGDTAGLRARYAMISDAIDILRRGSPNAAVYLDAGHNRRNTPDEIAPVLAAAGVAKARGFFTNATSYEYASTEVAFGRAVSARLAALGVPDRHFVVDTSRAGRGPNLAAERQDDTRTWCNQPDRALGAPPTTLTGEPLADAFVWLKGVWQSDGTCDAARAEPATGQPFWEYALALARNAEQPFADLPADPEARAAVLALARRGVIRGNGDGTFGADAETLRAQMAALLARPMGWELESAGNKFGDRGAVDGALWRNVGVLAHYGVARGYADGTYNPTGPVLHQQVLLFIARAMVTKGYWQQQPDDAALFPNLPAGTAQEQADRRDLATYARYTQALGGVPGHAATAPFADFDRPAPRWWFAVALYRALQSTPAPTAP